MSMDYTSRHPYTSNITFMAVVGYQSTIQSQPVTVTYVCCRLHERPLGSTSSAYEIYTLSSRHA